MKKLFVVLLVFTSVLFSQWNNVDLMPLSGSIQSFYLIDSLNIVAHLSQNFVSGDTQRLIRSRDGGRTWEFIHILPFDYNYRINFVDSLYIFAFSPLNGISKSADGGASWVQISFPFVVVEILRINFVTPFVCYALVDQRTTSGDKTRLIKTTNAGTDWVTLDTTINQIREIQFDDVNNGWLFGNSVYRTTDAGSTFTIFPTPSGIENFRSVDTMGNNIVFAGYRYFFIPPMYSTRLVQTALSTDGGSTWRVKDHGETMEGDPKKIKFIDSNTVAVLRPWFGSEISKSILYTTDKGLTWSEGNFPENTYYYNDLQILDGRVYMAGGQGATFVASGQVISEPWEIRIATEMTSIMAADFSKSGLVVAISGKPQIYISRDKGNNWFKRFSLVHSPGSVFISNDTTVYVASRQILYKTDDLFSSIDTIAQFPGLVKNIQIKNNGDIWLSSNNVILFSSDTGMSWVTRYTSTGYSVSGLEVFDDGTVYAAIDGGVLKSTDYGVSWVTLSLPVQNVYLIDFYDSKNGFIGKQGEAFYRTRDGGLTFQQLTIPGMSAPQKLSCQDSLIFMLSANELYSTYNGGWNWKVNEFSTQPTYKNFGWMYLFNQLDGIVIGYDKRDIFITTNAGNTPVELSSFTASQYDKKVMLSWTTETETNNMGFEIERRDKYGDWKKIAFSKGSGTSTRKIFYGYDDYEPKAPAILYYRLKQIDYNGEFEYSNEVEVLLGEVPESYSIQQNYPNPFNPSTKLTFSLPEENKVVIRVFNAMGEQVKAMDRGVLSHGYFEQDLEMGIESSGMYFCQVLCTNTISGRTKSLTIKMVLMK